jgi:hypothetical protein
MTLTPEQFKRAAEVVESIIFPEGKNIDLKDVLNKSADGITDKRARRDFYRHMNILFLNVLLNRLDEVGPDKEDIAINARKRIVELINAL